MFAVWLAIALAEPLTAADHQRLLGSGTEAPAPATAPTPPELPWWPLPIALAAAGGWAWLKHRGGRLMLTRDEEMRVIAKSAMGPQHGLCLVEVRDADGGWRRLLVAHGPQGPQLLTGLGSRVAFDPELAAAAVDDLPEVVAFAVAEPRARIAGLDTVQAAPPPIRHEAPPIRHDPPPIRLDAPPIRPLASEVRVPRGYAEVAASAPAPAPARNVHDGLALLAEVRRAKTGKGLAAWA